MAALPNSRGHFIFWRGIDEEQEHLCCCDHRNRWQQVGAFIAASDVRSDSGALFGSTQDRRLPPLTRRARPVTSLMLGRSAHWLSAVFLMAACRHRAALRVVRISDCSRALGLAPAHSRDRLTSHAPDGGRCERERPPVNAGRWAVRTKALLHRDHVGTKPNGNPRLRESAGSEGEHRGQDIVLVGVNVLPVDR